MKPQSDESREFTYKYIFEDNYNPLYVTGAYGGLVPTGEIVAHFFLDRQPLPHCTVHAMAEDGELGEELRREPPDVTRSLVRYVQTGIVMNVHQAKIIHRWLGKKIQDAEDYWMKRAEADATETEGEA